jgi:hypothetical protein
MGSSDLTLFSPLCLGITLTNSTVSSFSHSAVRVASFVLIPVGITKISATCDTLPQPTISVAQKDYNPNTSDRMSSSEKSTAEMIPHANTLALPFLEALIAQHEERSKEALGGALAKKQEVCEQSTTTQPRGPDQNSGLSVAKTALWMLKPDCEPTHVGETVLVSQRQKQQYGC